ITAAEKECADAAARLAAAAAAAPGQEFTAGGQTMTRAVLRDPSPRIWAEETGTGKRRDLTAEEEHAVWAWAVIEVLRHTDAFSAGRPLWRKPISTFAQLRG